MSATKGSPKKSFHVNILKIPVQKVLKRVRLLRAKSMYMQKQSFVGVL